MLCRIRTESPFSARKSPLPGRRGRTRGTSAVVHAAGILLATDGQVSEDNLLETAALIAESIDGAAVVSLSSASTESPFQQLVSSVGSIVHTVPIPTQAPSCQAYRVTGTAADAISIATEPKQGLLSYLGLDPVLCLVLGKGSAVGPDADRSVAVALARQSAVAGVPALACALASTKPSASWEPVLDALWYILPAVNMSLEAANGYPAAANFPRAHYPFPERGRCALGVGVPLHPSVSRTAHSGGGGGAWALEDCWSLGEEVPPGAEPASALSPEEAEGLLRAAFADADIFLNVSVPPRAPQRAEHGPRFAATRCGVIWHRDEVQRAAQAAPAGPQEDLSRSGATDRDLWGRSLPAQTLSSDSPASLAAGAFVSQDQTSAVAARSRGDAGASARGADSPVVGAETVSFSVGRGRTLSDPVVAGDVDALFRGCVTVSAAQTWPAGHPCSLTDAALAAAIAEDEETGLPLWLLP